MPRLGLLAVATSSSEVKIYSVPHPDALHATMKQDNSGETGLPFFFLLILCSLYLISSNSRAAEHSQPHSKLCSVALCVFLLHCLPELLHNARTPSLLHAASPAPPLHWGSPLPSSTQTLILNKTSVLRSHKGAKNSLLSQMVILSAPSRNHWLGVKIQSQIQKGCPTETRNVGKTSSFSCSFVANAASYSPG